MTSTAARASGVLPRACTCGHDHQTHRGEDVHYCLECSCSEHIPRCQNCGAEASGPVLMPYYDVCSTRCARQIEYALALESKS